MLEKTLVKNIRRAVDDAGGMSIKLHGSPYQQAGLPDLIVIMKGVVTFLEVKTPSGEVSPVQDALHKRMRRHYARVHVVRSVEQAMGVVRDNEII